VPRTRWRDGVNFLTVAFSRANVPASVDPNSRDTRPLAGRFNLIAVMPAVSGFKPTDARPELTRAFRINEPPSELLDENAAWLGDPHKPPTLKRPQLQSLLGRLGFDPDPTMTKLEQGSVDLGKLAETVAYNSACLNDTDFIRLAYATILNRAADADGQRYFESALKKRETRAGVTRALIDSNEMEPPSP
jgi:hypothetical protein